MTVPITIRAFFIPQLKYLAENGFDVSVVCSKDDSLQKELGKKSHIIQWKYLVACHFWAP